MTARKKPPPHAPTLEQLIEDTRLEIEREALVTISSHVFDLFEDAAFMAALRAATGKKKLNQRLIDAVALDIKERVLEDIARIFNEGLY